MDALELRPIGIHLVHGSTSVAGTMDEPCEVLAIMYLPCCCAFGFIQEGFVGAIAAPECIAAVY